jgi:hypothetical protein
MLVRKNMLSLLVVGAESNNKLVPCFNLLSSLISLFCHSLGKKKYSPICPLFSNKKRYMRNILLHIYTNGFFLSLKTKQMSEQ